MPQPRIFLGAFGILVPAGVLTFSAIQPSSAPAIDPVQADRPDQPIAGAMTWVTDAMLSPALPLNADLVGALASRQHKTALAGLRKIDARTLAGNQARDRAFLEAWEAIRAGDAESAVGLLDEVKGAEHVPDDYKQITAAELLLAAGKPVEAAEAAAQVSSDSGVASRAAMTRAQALEKAGRTAESLAAWQALADRPDPSPGTATALLTLARRKGIGSEGAYNLLRRLWSQYPESAEAKQADAILSIEYETKGKAFRARDSDIANRADRLMEGHEYSDVTKWLGSMETRFVTPDENACMAWYAYGRSHFKLNNITKAAEVLGKAGKSCVGIDKDRGAKSYYIAGKALERKKQWADAARMFEKIPELYPGHSMADDGYALAGIAWQNAGEPAKAVALLQRQVDEYPDGDLAAEGFWRLAWQAFQDGQTDEAIRIAEKMIWQVPLASDPVHVVGAHYWAARWRIYPDRDNPKAKHADPKRVALGVDQLVQLCKDQPTHFYSLLAAARLYELAPTRVQDLPRPTAGPDRGLQVREAWMEHPATQRAFALARLGLVAEALIEFDSVAEQPAPPAGDPLPGEEALVAKVVAMRNPFEAHDRLHHYLLDHPASSLGADSNTILRQAYTDHYWDLVQKAAKDYGYDPRVFHALVREESSFNEKIVSWAGAKGLSQLMPATANTVAGWMGIKVNSTTIYDPLTNLRIGSRYLEYLRGYFGGNIFLAVPAYNAGEGNVGKWLKATANPPTDEFIESIPIRETRHYVKRVLGTYQLYNSVYGTGPLYPDWSVGNHQAKP